MWTKKDSPSTHSFRFGSQIWQPWRAYFNFRRQSIIWFCHNGGAAAYNSSVSSARNQRGRRPHYCGRRTGLVGRTWNFGEKDRPVFQLSKRQDLAIQDPASTESDFAVGIPSPFGSPSRTCALRVSQPCACSPSLSSLQYPSTVLSYLPGAGCNSANYPVPTVVLAEAMPLHCSNGLASGKAGSRD